MRLGHRQRQRRSHSGRGIVDCTIESQVEAMGGVHIGEEYAGWLAWMASTVAGSTMGFSLLLVLVSVLIKRPCYFRRCGTAAVTPSLLLFHARKKCANRWDFLAIAREICIYLRQTNGLLKQMPRYLSTPLSIIPSRRSPLVVHSGRLECLGN